MAMPLKQARIEALAPARKFGSLLPGSLDESTVHDNALLDVCSAIDADGTVVTYRSKAIEHSAMSKDAHEEYRIARQDGNVALADRLAWTRAWHLDQQKLLDRIAALELVRKYNPGYGRNRRSLHSLDVHELHIDEAEQVVDEHIKLCKEESMRQTFVVTGWGKHSKDGQPLLRPHIRKFVQALGYRAVVDSGNKGRLILYLQSSL